MGLFPLFYGPINPLRKEELELGLFQGFGSSGGKSRERRKRDGAVGAGGGGKSLRQRAGNRGLLFPVLPLEKLRF